MAWEEPSQTLRAFGFDLVCDGEPRYYRKNCYAARFTLPDGTKIVLRVHHTVSFKTPRYAASLSKTRKGPDGVTHHRSLYSNRRTTLEEAEAVLLAQPGVAKVLEQLREASRLSA